MRHSHTSLGKLREFAAWTQQTTHCTKQNYMKVELVFLSSKGK
ncbi:hypothetical protein [Psychrobacter sp. CAL346-MNA-CIBAN-0220]